MKLTADYHTHTKYSHGKGTVMENALQAKAQGLTQIGITDHGFAHPAFGLRKRKMDSLISDCKNATDETGVQVLVGIESNIVSVDGRVDLTPKMYDKFDLFIAGVHKLVWFKPNSFFQFGMENLFNAVFKVKNPTDALYRRNTKAYINTIINNPVDIISHVNFFCPCDVIEVAKVAGDYGTLIELNSKKIHLSEEQLYNLGQLNVKFVIDSDAHTADRVGEISLIEKQLSAVDFPMDKIMNIDGRLPDFRFRAFKEKNL